MRAEFESFSSEGRSQHFGPLSGNLCADQPRHVATKIGPGRVKPKRLTIPELVVQLESQNRTAHLSAAQHLLREFCPHNPDDEHPEIFDPLSRILQSDLETDVRSAAAAMLGSYGDVRAIDPLIKALHESRANGDRNQCAILSVVAHPGLSYR